MLKLCTAHSELCAHNGGPVLCAHNGGVFCAPISGSELCARHTKKFSSKKLGCSSTAHFSNVVAQRTLKIVIRVEGKKEKCLHLGLNQGPSDLIQTDRLHSVSAQPDCRPKNNFRPKFFLSFCCQKPYAETLHSTQ